MIIIRVKLNYDYFYEDEETAPIIFEKGRVYDVIHSFTHEAWGVDDHLVFVIVNEEGQTMSVARELVECLGGIK